MSTYHYVICSISTCFGDYNLRAKLERFSYHSSNVKKEQQVQYTHKVIIFTAKSATLLKIWSSTSAIYTEQLIYQHCHCHFLVKTHFMLP